MIGEYDYGSIMHYSAATFMAKDKGPTFELVKGQEHVSLASIGNRYALSKGDVDTVNKMYPSKNVAARKVIAKIPKPKVELRHQQILDLVLKSVPSSVASNAREVDRFDCKNRNMGSIITAKCSLALQTKAGRSKSNWEAMVQLMPGGTPDYVIYFKKK